ncbi:MAG: hypothetical protein IJA87_00090 [Clostridia bacterium]|nr:hypothetical protein [Clostridia bacterium]
MVKQEFLKVLNSRKGKYVFCVLMIISIVDNISGIVQSGPLGYLYNTHPAMLSLLSGQAGLIFYALFVWLLPITLMIVYCDKVIKENRTGITRIYLSKCSRKSFFGSKILVSFFVPCVYCGIPLLTNLLINVLFNSKGTSFFGLEQLELKDIGWFWYNSIHYPYITWFVYFLSALFVFGLLSVMCQCVSMIANDNKTAYIVSFAVWITLFCSKYNITMIIQPYTEYDHIYGIKALFCLLPCVLFSVLLAYIKTVVRKDEF